MKILVADDSSFIRTVIVKKLGNEFPGAEIISCSNGKEAYEKIVSIKPDIVLTDLLMPEMTGEELLKRLKSEGHNVNTIVVSADVQSRTREEIKALGVVEFINKPITPDKLEIIINFIRGIENA
ncbi:MAG TPA: response regulator [Oscillospiraceae bacterium]|jgi:two-component system chemotaxis response regulator CheY|nr:response regulator [Oscillospiraceae bacterium]